MASQHRYRIICVGGTYIAQQRRRTWRKLWLRREWESLERPDTTEGGSGSPCSQWATFEDAKETIHYHKASEHTA